MTWVKICGMTNLEDALTAVEAGADAVGFVFYEKSPRNISVEAAREIVEKLPESVEKIGVFVIGTEPDPVNILIHAQLTGAQYYFLGGSDARQGGGTKAIGMSAFARPPRFLMALPIKMFADNEEQIQTTISNFAKWGKNLPEGFSLPEGMMDTFLLDSGDLRTPGGTGKAFEWKKAVPIAEAMRQGGLRLVVAGGLTAGNVGDAIGTLKPWGVDVASGVEARPGKKDPEKVRTFVKAVRDTDRKAS
ncbi:MAG TPA: phosphoribosylanthranilate isomerase [Candidatus Acidoferrum sp.]|jgi:phosphoribosylanthranilate isomerase|nr:phosphoribosylanthranilate isomerase [Candidatus Acidoferrum sp.]